MDCFFVGSKVRRAIGGLTAVLAMLVLPAAAQNTTPPEPSATEQPTPAVRTNTLVVEALTITGGNPGVGKVLTSDAAGAGKWAAAPQTATLVYTGTLPDKPASTTYIALPANLSAATIVGITAVVPLDKATRIPPNYTALADQQYQVSVVGQQIRLDTGNSSRAVLGKPVSVLLTYLPTSGL